MKRCPECQFLYEDSQKCCDMDGTVLKFTTFLPQLAPSQDKSKDGAKSIWGGLAIPLLTLIVIGNVLVTLYRATPPTFSSSAAATHQSAVANESKLPVSDSPKVVTTPAIPAKTTDPFALPETRTQNAAANSSRPLQSTGQKRVSSDSETPAPFEPPSLVVNAPKPLPNQTSPAAPANQKITTSVNAISVHPEPLRAKPTPQSNLQNQDKDSKVKSLFRKAGRVFKKPF